jgi:hypothetical protein
MVVLRNRRRPGIHSPCRNLLLRQGVCNLEAESGVSGRTRLLLGTLTHAVVVLHTAVPTGHDNSHSGWPYKGEDAGHWSSVLERCGGVTRPFLKRFWGLESPLGPSRRYWPGRLQRYFSKIRILLAGFKVQKRDQTARKMLPCLLSPRPHLKTH